MLKERHMTDRVIKLDSWHMYIILKETTGDIVSGKVYL